MNMKKTKITPIVFMILGLFIILSGCNKKEPVEKEPVKEPVEKVEDVDKEEVDKDKVMKDFDDITVKNNTDEIIGFIDEKINKLSTIEGDKMISDLEDNLEKGLKSQTDNLLKLDSNEELIQISNELFFPEDKIKDIKDEKLREEVERLFNNKYKLINVEAEYYPIIDYEKLKKYNDNISPEFKDYIAIKALDSNMPVAIDGGLYINHEDLADRILKTEEFLQKYSGGQRQEEMLKEYRNKLSIYMIGIPNTPIANRDTNKIDYDILKSYKKVADVKDSVTAFIMRKYINIIEENEFIINDVVKESTLSLINESISLLEANK
jgi:hypothetical protein